MQAESIRHAAAFVGIPPTKLSFFSKPALRGTSLLKRHVTHFSVGRRAPFTPLMHTGAYSQTHSHNPDHDHDHEHSSCCGCGSTVTEAPKTINFGPLLGVVQSVLDARYSLILAILGMTSLLLGVCFKAATAATASFVALSKALFIISAIATLTPILLASVFEIYNRGLAGIGVAVLMAFASFASILTGCLFEGALLSSLYALSISGERAMALHAGRALQDLREMTPEEALVLLSGSNTDFHNAPVADVMVGDRVLVRAGEMVPCDGVVAEGTCGAFISTPHLTGESTPRSVNPGDDVPAGARTVDTALIVRVTRVGTESSLARIDKLVSEAQSAKPSFVTAYDKIGARYSQTVLFGCLALAVLLPLFVPAIAWTGAQGSFVRALGLLIVFSPCALILGAPLAYIAALSTCARKGIFVKTGAQAIERAAKAKHVVFDKTGTLTEGKLAWVGCERLHGSNWVQLDQSELHHVVGVSAALEQKAFHPVAAAILDKANKLRVKVPDTKSVLTVPGQGIEGHVNGEDITRIGQPGFASNSNVSGHVEYVVSVARKRGETIAVMQHEGEHYVIRLRDVVRSDAAKTVNELQKTGSSVTVLTGDGEGAAAYVARAVGLDHKAIVSDAAPASKLDYIHHASHEAERKGGTAIMIGDGVNDAPALAAAHVGVACGLSSATAVHAADVVLSRDGISQVAWFANHARRTQRVVTLNLLIGLVAMFGCAFPMVTGNLPLWVAVVGHEGSTLLVGLNGLRLLR